MSSPPRERSRFLVLGGGAVVAEFYLPALMALGWIGDGWVADLSRESLARLTTQCPELNVLQVDFQAALAGARELGIQSVIVALPNALHEAAVTAALERGLDVLCEKPLALTEAACARLAALARQRGRVLAVGMTRRFLPSTNAIRQVLDAGWIGSITSIEIEDGHNFAWSSESGGYGRRDNAGVLANIGVHVLDLAEYLCGPLSPISYTDDWHGGVEVNATFGLQTSAGAPVSIKLSYTHNLANVIRIHGTRGVVWQTPDASGVHYRGTDSELDADITIRQPYRYGDWPLTNQGAICEEFSDFQDAIERRRAPFATADDAARIARHIDWAYAHHTADRLAVRASVQPVRARLETGRMVITGGTGFVGGHLIEALANEGHTDLVVPVRTFQRSANTWRFPVKLQRADLLEPSSLREIMKGARYVFHLAYGRDGTNAGRVTIEGTRNVIEAAIDASVECVVVLSTTAVFGDPGGTQLVDESFPYSPPNREYETTKAKAERWTLARAKREAHTRIVVINPSCIYGPGGKTFTELPARLLEEGAFCWIDDGRGIVNYVYVTNLVDAILLAAARKDAHGERFIVSDGSTTWREFFTVLFGSAVADLPSHTRNELVALAREQTPSLRDVARTVVRSGELWRMVGENPSLATTKAILERVTPGLYKRVKNTRHQPPTPPAAARGSRAIPPVFLDILFGVSSTHMTAEKARQTLGWTSTVDLATGQARSRAWLADVGLLAHGA
jgi:predicted dehydrogenase/nucleoside-diphosphate-sugar epimerase